MNILCNLPRFPDDVQNHSDYVRTKVQLALESNLEINVLTRIPDETRATIYFSTALANKLKEMSAKLDIPPGRIAGLLVHAANSIQSAEKSYLDHFVPELRPEQLTLLRTIVPGVQAEKIVVAEASTGVGKSLTYCLIALNHFRTKENPRAVLIGTPTIQTLTHMVSEFLHATEIESRVYPDQRALKLCALLGRSQFVNLRTVEEFLGDFPDAGVQRWLDSGAPAGFTQSTTFLNRIHPGIAGLMEDLVEIATDFPAGDCALQTEDNEKSWYDTLKDSALTSDVVFTTHTMLAYDTLNIIRRKEENPESVVFPPYDILLLDEGHQVEDGFASAQSTGLAFSRLRSTLTNENWKSLKTDTLAQSVLRSCEIAMLVLKDFPDNVSFRYGDERPQIWKERAAPMLDQLRATISPLLAAMDKKKATNRDSYYRLKDAKFLLEKVLEEKDVTSISFAPTKRWPTLAIGPSRVGWLLARRWKMSPAVVLISATFYVLEKSGAWDARATLRQLALKNNDRVVVLPPVYTKWLFEIPKVFLPTGQMRAYLTPPRLSDVPHEIAQTQMTAWMQYVALVLKQSSGTAKGGTLVLMSGYDRIECLGGLLTQLGDRLIVQTKQMNFAACRSEYFRLAKDGKRPVWLGTGAAGTGLDLSDRSNPPQNDFLLTDLVIPNVPIGMNQSTTHKSRAEYFGFAEEMSAAFISMKQWVGRLVRRDGVQFRRLWVLDGRIATVSGFYNVAYLLDRYPHQVEFNSLEELKILLAQ